MLMIQVLTTKKKAPDPVQKASGIGKTNEGLAKLSATPEFS